HFLVVLASAKTSEDFLEWYGLVESRIRLLIVSLEYNHAIKTIHINPTSFTTQDEEYVNKPHAAWFIGIEFKKSENINIDLTNDINKFVEFVYVKSTYNKAYKDGMEVNCKYLANGNEDETSTTSLSSNSCSTDLSSHPPRPSSVNSISQIPNINEDISSGVTQVRTLDS
ncbi:hypothetical protein Anas_08806, partial [Armadillidium nasatum]